uniref:Uncharacterized protein n=1 Tax=Alexandrium catenella TaxID=2925 RepID=A0A7S1S485_ALECA
MMYLKLYRFLGAIYGGNLLFVLLPGLYLTQQLSVGSQVDSLHGALDGHGGHSVQSGHRGGFAGYSGIMLVLLLWSAARLVGCVWGVYWLEVPRRMAMLRDLEESCSREVLLAWLRNRCECSEEEFQAEKALLKEKSPGEEREAFRRRDDGPFATFTREHDTTIVAIESMAQRLYAQGDRELQELVHKVVFRESS